MRAARARRAGAARAHRRRRSSSGCASSTSRSRRASPRRSTGRSALAALGPEELDAEVVEATLGSVLKYHEDLETVRDAALAELVEEARAAPVADAVVRHVVTFGRVLREAGLEVGPGRIADALTGLDHVELAHRDDVYWALRQTLVSRARRPRSRSTARSRAWFRALAATPALPRPRAAREPRLGDELGRGADATPAGRRGHARGRLERRGGAPP